MHSNSRSAQQVDRGRLFAFWWHFMLLVTHSLLQFCSLQNSVWQFYQLVMVYCLILANFHLSRDVIMFKVRGSLDQHSGFPTEIHYLHSQHYAKGQTYFCPHTHTNTQQTYVYIHTDKLWDTIKIKKTFLFNPIKDILKSHRIKYPSTTFQIL